MEIDSDSADDTQQLMQELLPVQKICIDLLTSELVKDDVWFLVDQKWFIAFLKYVGLCSDGTECMGEKHPGPVDNSSLLKDNELKEYLQEGVDFGYVPEELWNHFKSWFGIIEGQEPLARKVIDTGLFVCNLKIEVYLIRLKLCKDFDTSFAILEKFSEGDSIVHIAKTCRRLFNIQADTDIRLWSCSTNIFEQLVMTSNVYYEALYEDQIIIVETRMEDGSWRRQPESSASIDTFIHRGMEDLSKTGGGTSTDSPGALISKEGNASQPDNTSSANIDTFTDHCMEDLSKTGDGTLTDSHGALNTKDENASQPDNTSSANIDTFTDHGMEDLSQTAAGTLTDSHGALNTKDENASQPDNTRASVCSGEGQMQSTREVPGLCGLLNLGNTCYMNSVIQCMSNCPPVAKYFIEDQYSKELNKTNPLGRKGEIAGAFGSLMKTLWSGQHSCTAPKNFKLQVGKFAPQFSYAIQNDCHELLTFLLDGLHEDLNRIPIKPRIEPSDSEGHPDELLADEAWCNHLRHNDSIIIDNFHGLLKSTLVCPLCTKSSVTFDPFCYLSLPVPIKNERCIEVTLFPHDSWKIPKIFKVMVPKNGFIHDLLLGLNQLCGLSPDELLVTEIARCKFRKIFSHEDTLASIGDDDYIAVYEVPNIENHIRVPVCHWEYKGERFSLNHLFGHPVMVLVPEDSFTADNVFDIVLMKLCRHLTNPDQKGAMLLLHLTKMYDDSDISAAAMKSLMSSLPRSLFSLHIIQGSAVDEFPGDVGQASALCTLGRRYLAAQWKPEDRAEYYNEEALDELEQHESVSQAETDKTSLLDCLKLYTMCEKLGADDAWFCPACKKHQPASKRIELWRLPSILVIHLKRFTFTRYTREKVNTLVHFPLEDFDVSEFVSNTKLPAIKYKLVGVCNHFGALGSGHYTAFALNKPTNQWYEFDDNRVTEIPSHSVVTNSAYVLFYLKQD